MTYAMLKLMLGFTTPMMIGRPRMLKAARTVVKLMAFAACRVHDWQLPL
jgi:hypothetical protein